MTVLLRITILTAIAAALVGFGAYAQTTGTFKDSRDGKTYKTVTIDGKTWMAENLNFAAKGSKCYEDKDANCAKYGRLYDWNTALKACPAGYHLPTDDDWTELTDAVGGSKTAGTKLKSAAGWNEDGNGTDDYGWSAVPGGIGDYGGDFGGAGMKDLWWSATERDRAAAWYRIAKYNYEYVGRYNDYKKSTYSVRCVQD